MPMSWFVAPAGESVEWKNLLQRCSRVEVFGLCLFEIANEATASTSWRG
jgi:hypothetical protein